MPASQKLKRSLFSNMQYFTLILLLGFCGLSKATEVEINAIGSEIQNEIHVINADIHYELGEEVIEALENGIVLTFYVEIDFYRPRSFIWDEELVHLTKNLKLSYHPLSDQYVVSDTITDDHQSFNTLQDALDNLGKVAALPVIESKFIDPEQAAIGRIQTGIDIEELPAVMRLQAWLSSQWRTNSGWVEWEIYP